jgi:hypothetical protein
LSAVVQEQTGVAAAQQKLINGTAIIPRNDADAKLSSLGIKDGDSLTLICVKIPSGTWSGTYEDGSPFVYICTFHCDRWEWHDIEVGNVRFEMEWLVCQSHYPDAVGFVGVEVYEGQYDTSADVIRGKGTKIYLRAEQPKEGELPPVQHVIGITDSMVVKFHDDGNSASTYFLPDNVEMVLKRTEVLM